MEIAIIILLIANLLLGGWIMITLNEVDRTNHQLIRQTNLNQVQLAERLNLIAEKVEVSEEDYKKIL